MNKFILLILAPLFILFISCQEEIKGPNHLPNEFKINQFEQHISSLMGSLDVSEYGYVIASNKEAIASIERGITGDREFPVGDISDLFYAIATLKLSEEGKINTNDRVDNTGSVKELLSFTYQPTVQNINYRPANFQSIQELIADASNEEISTVIKTSVLDELDMGNTTLKAGVIYSCLNDLHLLSRALDNQKIFETEDTHELMMRPVYLENGERTPSGLGCYIDISDDGKIVWSQGQSDGYATLMIKSVTDSITLLLVARSDILNVPLSQEPGNLNNSPVFHAFSNSILTKDSLPAIINFLDEESLEGDLRLAIDSGKRDQAYYELLAYLKLFEAAGKHAQFESLASVYQKVFPLDLPVSLLMRQPKASVQEVMDYMRYQRTFSLPTEDTVRIIGTAEYDKQMQLNPWEYDLVDMYFDINHERTTTFNTRDDRQYRFHYDWDKSTGNAPTLEGFVIRQSEPSATSYNLEVVIPRETLFNTDTVNFMEGMQFGFDLILSDNDGNGQEGLLSWRSDKGTTPWTNTSTYGTLALVKSTSIKSDTIYFAPKSKGKVTLDGKNTGEWNDVPVYIPEKEFRQENIDPEDLSGRFRLQWDENNIYFFIEVQDDYKKKIEETADFGWITNAEQDTVWIQTIDICKPAGGHSSNMMVDTSVQLPEGNYVLHYWTNQSHSFGRWTKERPELTFSGIVVY